jgi:hypothetical protein
LANALLKQRVKAIHSKTQDHCAFTLCASPFPSLRSNRHLSTPKSPSVHHQPRDPDTHALPWPCKKNTTISKVDNIHSYPVCSSSLAALSSFALTRPKCNCSPTPRPSSQILGAPRLCCSRLLSSGYGVFSTSMAAGGSSS